MSDSASSHQHNPVDPFSGVKWALDVLGAKVMPVHGVERRPVFGTDELESDCTCGSPHEDGACATCWEANGKGVATAMTDECRAAGHRGMVSRDIGKHPVGDLVHNGWRDATTDRRKVNKWWAVDEDGDAHSPWNYAVVLFGSDLVVADVDGPEGEEEWARIVAGSPELTHPTAEVRTGSGRHIFFRWAPSEALRARLHGAGKAFTGKWPDISGKTLKHVDLRLEGYLVGAGSMHRRGTRYEIIDASISPADLPQQWADRLTEHFSNRAEGASIANDIALDDLMDPETVLKSLTPRQEVKAREVLDEASAPHGRSEQTAHAWGVLAGCVVYSGFHDPEDATKRVVTLLARKHTPTIERWSEKPHLPKVEMARVAESVAGTIERREEWLAEKSTNEKLKSIIPALADGDFENPAVSALRERLERFESGYKVRNAKSAVETAKRARNSAKRDWADLDRRRKRIGPDDEHGEITVLKNEIARAQIALDESEAAFGRAQTDLEEVESKGGSLTGADVLFAAFAENFILARDPYGNPIAIPQRGTRIATPVEDIADLLLAKAVFSDGSGQIPSAGDVKQAVSALRGLAVEHNAPKLDVASRWYHEINTDTAAETIWLNLNNNNGEVVKVTPQGWEVLPGSESPNAWIRLDGGMPAPTRDADMGALWDIVNIPDEFRPLIRAWLVSCAFPNYSVCCLSFQGSAGAGKTSAGRMITGLIDDFESAVKAPRMLANPDDLVITFGVRRAVVIDNITRYDQDTSDILCGIVTGTGIQKRRLYSNAQTVTIQIQGAMIITGVAPVGAGPDLMQRTLVVQMNPPKIRLDEDEIIRKYRAVRPGLIGCVLDDLVTVLKRNSEGFVLPPERRPRLTAYGRVLGILDEKYGTDGLTTMLETSADQIMAVAMDDPIVDALCRLVRDEVAAAPGGNWQIDNTTLTQKLALRRPQEIREDKWPNSPRWTGQMVMQNAPVLLNQGFLVEKGRPDSATRRQTLVFSMAPVAVPAPVIDTTEPAATGGQAPALEPTATATPNSIEPPLIVLDDEF